MIATCSAGRFQLFDGGYAELPHRIRHAELLEGTSGTRMARSVARAVSFLTSLPPWGPIYASHSGWRVGSQQLGAVQKSSGFGLQAGLPEVLGATAAEAQLIGPKWADGFLAGRPRLPACLTPLRCF